ncbi:ABC transporter ATP-binding protein [Sphaerimonospora thailandensis]|uniref:ABC transporter ATP-binding protein n=1 Tax=Sphaerimonospora thailandensis TaxID=795644 RepID=A0A8J3W0G3_9ACTN|nr:ABC transporter ATP-binding protein [Sphaerimonospora thailandensis]GIH72214.1 ABC transporter ATP-binding protein [Sphaerimonospora thailandensis]
MKETLHALRFIYGYPLRYRRAMTVATLTMLAGLLSSIAIPLVMRVAIDAGVLGGDPGLLLVIAVGVLAIGAVSATLLHLGKQLRFKVASRAVNDLRHDLFRNLLRLGPADTAEASGGRALTRLVSDAVFVRGLTNGGLLELLNQLLVTSVMYLVAMVIDVRTTLLASIPLVIVIVGHLTVQGRLHRVFVEVKGQFTNLLSGVGESLSNIGVVKSFSREGAASDRLNKINEELSARRGSMKTTYSRWEAILNVVGALPTPIALWLGGAAVVEGGLTVGSLVALTALIMMVQMSMHMVTMHANGVFRSVVIAQRLLRIVEAPSVLDIRSGTRPMPSLTGALTATALVVDIGERRVLDEVSLDVTPGEVIAFVGPTGSGKTTLLHALARLRDPQSGIVRYDGTDVREYDLESLRRQVVCLPQRQWIFEGTLADNIRFARPDATPEEVAEAAGAAGLGHFPLERTLAADAADLSAGERQRVGLARVLLVDPAILFLDNPTANLDAETEAELLDTIMRVRRGRTLIIATQQPAVTRHVDRVIALNNGAPVTPTSPAAPVPEVDPAAGDAPSARPLASAGLQEGGKTNG